MDSAQGRRKISGMFIDIHGHAFRRRTPQPEGGKIEFFCLPEELLKRYDELGVERGCLLPLIGPEVYLPQSNEDILEMVEGNPSRFVAFCNLDPRALRNSADSDFRPVLEFYKQRGVRGVGEFMPNLPWRHELVRNFLRCVQEAALPLVYDGATRLGGAYGVFDESGLVQLEATLRELPRLKILGHGPPFWAEIARPRTPPNLERYPTHPVEEEGAVPGLLRRHENLYGDLSAFSGYNALARDREYAVRFLNEFQDRLLFGTDLCRPDGPAPLAGLLLAFRDQGRISSTVFEKIARLNALRLLRL